VKENKTDVKKKDGGKEVDTGEINDEREEE
jgi:hypothetical protein